MNNTALSGNRPIIAIMENYQKEDGTIEVPKVLQQYMNSVKVIGER